MGCSGVWRCEVVCVSAEGVMRTMSTDKLMKGMPTLQGQIDALLEFEVSPSPPRLSALYQRTFWF